MCYPQRCSHVSSFHLRQVYERNHECATYTHHGEKSLGRRTNRRAWCRTSRRHTNQTDQAVGCDKHAGDPCVLLLSLSYLRRLHHHSLVSTATTALHVDICIIVIVCLLRLLSTTKRRHGIDALLPPSITLFERHLQGAFVPWASMLFGRENQRDRERSSSPKILLVGTPTAAWCQRYIRR